MSLPRYALYFTPPPFSAFAQFAAGVLGYDCFDGVEVPQLKVNGIEPSVLKLMTLEPRRYGFHATIVAPFRLRKYGEQDLIEAVELHADRTSPILLGALSVAVLGDFVAFVPSAISAEVSCFAAQCTKAFDRYRAPLSAVDRERRMRAGLTAKQIELLDRWGYPYVMEEFRFHMTLTGSVPADQRELFRNHLWRAYNDNASSVLEIDAVSLMRQDDPSSRFRVLRRCRLRG